jgi:hypothetical protein
LYWDRGKDPAEEMEKVPVRPSTTPLHEREILEGRSYKIVCCVSRYPEKDDPARPNAPPTKRGVLREWQLREIAEEKNGKSMVGIPVRFHHLRSGMYMNGSDWDKAPEHSILTGNKEAGKVVRTWIDRRGGLHAECDIHFPATESMIHQFFLDGQYQSCSLNHKSPTEWDTTKFIAPGIIEKINELSICNEPGRNDTDLVWGGEEEGYERVEQYKRLHQYHEYLGLPIPASPMDTSSAPPSGTPASTPPSTTTPPVTEAERKELEELRAYKAAQAAAAAAGQASGETTGQQPAEGTIQDSLNKANDPFQMVKSAVPEHLKKDVDLMMQTMNGLDQDLTKAEAAAKEAADKLAAQEQRLKELEAIAQAAEEGKRAAEADKLKTVQDARQAVEELIAEKLAGLEKLPKMDDMEKELAKENGEAIMASVRRSTDVKEINKLGDKARAYFDKYAARASLSAASGRAPTAGGSGGSGMSITHPSGMGMTSITATDKETIMASLRASRATPAAASAPPPRETQQEESEGGRKRTLEEALTKDDIMASIRKLPRTQDAFVAAGWQGRRLGGTLPIQSDGQGNPFLGAKYDDICASAGLSRQDYRQHMAQAIKASAIPRDMLKNLNEAPGHGHPRYGGGGRGFIAGSSGKNKAGDFQVLDVYDEEIVPVEGKEHPLGGSMYKSTLAPIDKDDAIMASVSSGAIKVQDPYYCDAAHRNAAMRRQFYDRQMQQDRMQDAF